MIVEDQAEIALDLDAWEQSLLADVADLVAAGVAQTRAAPDKVAVVPVPHQCRPLVKTPEIAHRRIATYLERIIVQAFGSDPGPQPPRSEADQSDLMNAACRLCRGHCCTPGWSAKAQLGVEDIQRYRRRDPEATPAEILNRYLDLIPAEMTLGGCYYQGALGCTLPRDLRSQTCNTFSCRGQRVLASAERAGAKAAVMISSMRNWPAKAAVWDAQTGYAEVEDPEVEES